MSSPIRRARYRWLDVILAFVVGLMLVGIAWLPAQEPESTAKGKKSKATGQREERLDTIEKTLQTLLKLTDVLGLEILVTMTPPGKDRNGSTPDLDQARVKEHVTTPGGASLTIAIR